MLYKFRSKASGDVIMTSEVGDRLMRLIGREPAPQGIFQPAQMPGLIGQLESAVRDEEEARRRAEAEAAAEHQPDDASAERTRLAAADVAPLKPLGR